MTKYNCLLLSLLLLLTGRVCVAAVSPEYVARLKQKYPNTTFASVRESEVRGLYEVVMGKTVAYTDESARYFIFGNLFDMQEQRDLTVSRKESLQSQISFPKDSLGQAFVRTKGNGSRVIALFSDPDCPYCKKLEAQLERLDNVTIYTFMYPLVSLHPEAKGKAISIWCATDKTTAWDAWINHAVLPSAKDCTNPISSNIQLGERMGITGTPTMISTDGRKLAGAVSAERINSWLDEKSTTENR